MFDREFLARGLDEDVPCEMPLEMGKRCGRPASWDVPLGQAFLPCCPVHMEQALQIHRANKQQHRMFQRQLQTDRDRQYKKEIRSKEPDTEGFRKDLFPRPPKESDDL